MMPCHEHAPMGSAVRASIEMNRKKRKDRKFFDGFSIFRIVGAAFSRGRFERLDSINGRDRDRTDDLYRVKVALIPTELRARRIKFYNLNT
jgi:hypothetical protein